MFELEKAIASWRKRMEADPALEPGYIAELEAHLRDKVDDLTARGRTPEEAFEEAVRALGETGVIGSQFFKVYTPRRSGRPSLRPPRFIPALAWSHVRTAARVFRRNRAFTALNVLGLAVGLAVFILIMLFVRTEVSFDRYHANARNIYRILEEIPDFVYKGSNIFVSSPAPMGAAMVREFPEVRAAARIRQPSAVRLSRGDENFLERGFFWADPGAFDIFSFPLVRGDKNAFLANSYSILLSQRAARRYFGDSDPMGRTITYRTQEKAFDFRVDGIFRDVPPNSHFIMDVVAPFETMAAIKGYDVADWRDVNFYVTYVLLKEGTDPNAIDRKLPSLRDKYIADKPWARQAQRIRYFLQPLSRIHFSSGINFGLSQNAGDARLVLIFASIAVLVLMIACVNYMNLATALSLRRAKEVGLRKVVGAGKGQLIRQFLGESIILTFLALALALGLVSIALPAFRVMAGREIVFDALRDPAVMLGLTLLAAAVGAAAGSYPALVASAFRPIVAFKGLGAHRTKGRGLRNSLIAFQFTASIVLIICTLGVRSQLRFIHNRDMGYEREQIVVLNPDAVLRKNLEAFKSELRRNPAVLGVSASSGLPNDIADFGMKNNVPSYTLQVDYDFVGLFGLKIVQGRDFSRTFASDAGGACLINESARAALGWNDPLGRAIFVFGHDDSPRPIVGVVKDFHLHSLHLPITPLYIALNPASSSCVSIKIRGESIPQTLAFIRKTWERFSPEYPFEYSFFDDIFDQAYRAEERLGTIFSLFAGLAVFIACLGLVGLAAYAAERRTKEIGIRKVLGASTSGIIALLSRDFMKWVVVANIIAWPIGYLAMRSWLQNFAYRTNLTVLMFLGAASAAFFVAAAAVTAQTYRAARANPAESMRYE